MLSVQAAMTLGEIRTGWKAMKEWKPTVKTTEEKFAKGKGGISEESSPAGGKGVESETPKKSKSLAPEEGTPSVKPEEPAGGLPKRPDISSGKAILVEAGDAKTLKAVAHITPEKGYYDVITHGTEDSFHVLHNGKWVKVDHRWLANFMKSKGYRGEKIRLLACETGSDKARIAQDLANKVGAPVLAPSEKVWVYPDGSLSVGKTLQDHTGKWNTFTPGKRVIPTSGVTPTPSGVPHGVPPTASSVSLGIKGKIPKWLRERFEKAVIEEMKLRRGGETAEAWELRKIQGPYRMANPDPNLGPTQVRYQVRFYDTFNETLVDISVNYDVESGLFGIIKFASGR